jgi:ribonuclease HII
MRLELDYPCTDIIKGDGKSLSIASASILAKVTRDRLMVECDRLFPGYGFKQHKGYGTPGHLKAIKKLGLSSVHRKSFYSQQA